MFTLQTPNIKREIRQKFSVPTKWDKFWRFRGPGVRGFRKVSIFLLQNTHLYSNSHRLSHCVQIGWAVWPLGVFQKKVRKSQRLPYERHVVVNRGFELPFSLWCYSCILSYLDHDLNLLSRAVITLTHDNLLLDISGHFNRSFLLTYLFIYLLTYLRYHMFSYSENTPSLYVYSAFYLIFYHFYF